MTYGYHLGGQRIVVFFDLLDISSKQFSMITTADCLLSGSNVLIMWTPIPEIW